MSVLPDVLKENLRVVFCGTAASAKSAEVGAYYAGPGNRFWQTLHQIGLTPRLLAPVEFRQILNYGIGLTDMAKHSSGNDDILRTADFDADGLRDKIIHFAPSILAFTSKRAAMEFSGERSAYGWQGYTINETAVYVLPSPSGAARRYWDIGIWQQLADRIQAC